MKFSCRILALCMLFGAALSASINIVPPGSATEVGVWSDYYYVYTTTQPDHSFTLSMTDVTGNGLQFMVGTQTSNSLSFNFDSSHWSFAYRVKTDDANAPINLGYANSWNPLTDDPQFTTPGPVGYSFTLRSTFVGTYPTTTYLDTPSDPIKLYIRTPNTAGDLTFTPTFTGLPDGVTVTFSPNPIIIRQNQLSASFTFTNGGHGGDNNNAGAVGQVQVSWDVNGPDADKYVDPATSLWSFNIIKRSITVPTFSPIPTLGSYSNTMYFGVAIPANETLTITPAAADTTFSPSSVTLQGADRMVAAFNWQTTANSIDTSSKRVNFQVTGANGIYNSIVPAATLVVPKRTVTITTPSNWILSNHTLISITIQAPTPNSLTITPYSAANLMFNQTSVTFTGNMTAAVIGVTPTVTGADTISFAVSGPDAAWFNNIADINVNIVGGTISPPSNWFSTPIQLFVAQESERIPIRASFSPTHSVTAFFSAPDLKFNPPSVTFRNGSEQQYFTITPLYTDSSMSGGSVTVTTLLQGPDATWFNTPSFTVTVARRYIQTKWSAHVQDTNVRHLGKPYKVWVSLNYIGKGELVTVVPTSPYWSFEPKVLNFNHGTPRFEVTATPTGISGAAPINWVLGGKDGGLYSTVGNTNFQIQTRPLSVGSAVLSPDDRQKGRRYDVQDLIVRWDNYDNSWFLNSPSDLANYHTWSFEMRSAVLPDRELTITPKSAHLTFSPSSITVRGRARGLIDVYPQTIHNWDFNITNLYLSANFTVKPQAAGTHYVWFELSGGDADYYRRPTNIFVTQNLVTRPDSEPNVANSSPFLQPVFAFTALLSFICYLIM